MPTRSESLLPHLRRLASLPPDLDSDASLVGRFVRERDEAAFAALVGRYDRLVLAACRRVLRDPQQAQDAAQATWLLLARKAGALRRPERLSAWLYGAARRLALRCLRADARRRRREARSALAAPPKRPSDPLDELTARELLLALDEEVERLPEVQRLAVVLCCLEGLSQEEAGRRLGWTPGSVKGGLERGRNRLYARLARRGLTLAAVLGAAEVARAAVGGFAEASGATVRAATLLAAGQTVPAELVPARVTALTQGALRAMWLTKLKAVTAGLLVVALACCGARALGPVADAAGQGEPVVDPRQSLPRLSTDKLEGKAEAAGARPIAPKGQGKPAAKGGKEKERTLAELIRAATTEPGRVERYPVPPALSSAMRGEVATEIAGSRAVRAAYARLDAARERNVTWFEGVKELEKEKAVWCLASCLCHPHPDVQIRALRALGRLKDRRAVPFLVLYAEYMAVFVPGSESATIHDIVHTETAGVLSSLTGVRVTLRGQDPEGLLRGVRLWRRWLLEQKE
jgi:RNA polymerase sigma factor (sigma-70 family)